MGDLQFSFYYFFTQFWNCDFWVGYAVFVNPSLVDCQQGTPRIVLRGRGWGLQKLWKTRQKFAHTHFCYVFTSRTKILGLGDFKLATPMDRVWVVHRGM